MKPKDDSFREPSPVQEGPGERPFGDADAGSEEEAPGPGLVNVPDVPRDLLRDDDRIRTRWIHRAFFWTFGLALLWGIHDIRERPPSGDWLTNGVALLCMAGTAGAVVAFLTGSLFTLRRQETAGEKWARLRKKHKARRKSSSRGEGQSPAGPAVDPPAETHIRKGPSP